MFLFTADTSSNTDIKGDSESCQDDSKETEATAYNPTKDSNNRMQGTLPKDFNYRMQKMKRKITNLQTRLSRMQCKLHKVRREKARIEKSKNKQEMAFTKVFNPDQLLALGKASARGCKWSHPTIKKALQLRFACGPTGYEVLLKQKQPLPSQRTLRRRMENVAFAPGILHEVFQNLKLKVQGMAEHERECCLTLDEMSIMSSVEYDNSSGRILGNATLPGHNDIATHGLVFMMSGITTRWKQVVAYHYTGSSYDGATMKPIISDIIQLAADIGLHVLAVTSDMGSMNRAMWRSFGIVCGKDCQTVNKIKHPCQPNRSLYFLADVPHVLKNLKAALVNGQVITIPNNLVSIHNLQSAEVSVKPVQDLLEFQVNKDLKLAPKLTQATLAPSHFDKMKVSHALNFFSNSVASALRYLVECEGRNAHILTTAWFLDLCNRWFNLMSSRHPVMALSKLNPDQYHQAVTFLAEIIRVFKGIKIGTKGAWKPVQTGVILSTQSILDIQEEVLAKDQKFLLTSRFTQDCLENLFSIVRHNNPVPSPVEFKYALKIITISQFLKATHAGNYQEDDNEFLAEFADDQFQPTQEQVPEVNFNHNIPMEDLTGDELNSLYYLAGYCITRIVNNDKHCYRCLATVKGTDPLSELSARLTNLKEYKEGCLAHPTEGAFQYLLSAEKIFRNHSADQVIAMSDTKSQLATIIESHTSTFQFPQCHNIKAKLLSRFLGVRLHILCKKMRGFLLQTIRNGNLYAARCTLLFCFYPITACFGPPEALNEMKCW